MNAISSSITHNIKRQHDDEHIDIDIKTTNHLKNIMYPEKISTTKCEENTIIIIINTVIKNIFLYKEKQMVSLEFSRLRLRSNKFNKILKYKYKIIKL